MKVIFKDFDDTKLCLYDLRSNQFLEGGCVNKVGDEHIKDSLLSAANYVASRQFYTIVDLADNPRYTDNGYTESLIARRYLDVNPDIRGTVIEKIKAKNDKKFARKAKKEKKGAKYVPEKHVKAQTQTVAAEKPKSDPVAHEKPKTAPVADAPKKRGRPRKVDSAATQPKPPKVKSGKRGRPRKNQVAEKPKKEAVVNSAPKKRGRPRKNG